MVPSGIPPESVLGRYFFIYINDNVYKRHSGTDVAGDRNRIGLNRLRLDLIAFRTETERMPKTVSR